MKLHIETRAIRAASFAMAKKDIRYYLNGLLVSFKKDQVHAKVVATDGHVMSINKSYMEDISYNVDAEIDLIIPSETIINFLKITPKKQEITVIEAICDDRYRIDGIEFKAIDGKYPDWKSVVPDEKLRSEKGIQMNPNYYLNGYKSLSAYAGETMKTSGGKIYADFFEDRIVLQHSENPGLSAFLIMGFNKSEEAQAFHDTDWS